MLDTKDIIEKCKKGDPHAQRALFFTYGPKLRGVCLRYSKSKLDAEDIFQEAFIKIYSNIHKYKHEGSFEGLMKRIVINTAIDGYNKNKKLSSFQVGYEKLEDIKCIDATCETIAAALNAKELLELIDKLPAGYKIVFNLYTIEGYTHKEIGEILNISEGTSKSQLFKAKQMLKNILVQYNLMEEEGKYARQIG